MVRGYKPKILIVEGEQDKRIVPEFIEAKGITWCNKQKEPIVYIKSCGGYELITPDVISTELKASRLTHFGLMVDADDNPSGRWESIRNACLKSIPDFPEELPETGLIHTTNGIKFGVWIMPDNRMRGMLETFLAYVIPNESDPHESDTLWDYVEEVVSESRKKGAPFKETHTDKAKIYTWLAWQNEPGRQLHQAIKERILNPNYLHPKAQAFFDWFKTLYDL